MNLDQIAATLAAGLRYDGDERRRPGAGYQGAERRVADPSTEQDHPELHEPSGQ